MTTKPWLTVVLLAAAACGDDATVPFDDAGGGLTAKPVPPMDAARPVEGGPSDASAPSDAAAPSCHEPYLPPLCSPQGCSELNEVCEQDSDCCYTGSGEYNACIGGWCSFSLGGDDGSLPRYARSPTCLDDGGVPANAPLPGYTAPDLHPVGIEPGCADAVLCRDGWHDELVPQLCLETTVPIVRYARTDHVERVCLFDPMDRLYLAHLPITLRVPGWRVWGPGCNAATNPVSAQDRRLCEIALGLARTGPGCSYGL